MSKSFPKIENYKCNTKSKTVYRTVPKKTHTSFVLEESCTEHFMNLHPDEYIMDEC
jgi:hypothetical protein